MRGTAPLLAVALLVPLVVAIALTPSQHWHVPTDARPHLMPPDPNVQSWPPYVAQGEPLSPPSPTQTSGVARAIVLLIDFQDVSGDSSHDGPYFNGIFNGEGPTAGSLRSYYQEVSFGSLTVNATIIPTWWRSSRTMAYYGADSANGVDDANGPVYRLVVEAVQAADPTTDFRPFDTDSDGVVDHVIVVHAGAGQENTPGNTDLVWSHRWAVLDADPLTPGSQSLRPDGVQVYGYIMVSEFSPIGVVTHEFGHDLGLPDLYDTDRSSEGVGVWDLMGGGSWNGFPPGSSPAHPNAWSRLRLGWANVLDVTTALVGTSVPAVEASGDVYRLRVRTTSLGDEYFLIENRQPTGFDAALPGFGLLIWHVDDTVAGNDNDAHRLVDLEEADETTSGDRPLDASDPWRDTTTGFGPDTVPNSHAYDGSETGWRVRDISASGNPMTATIAKTIGTDAAVSEIRIPPHAARNESVVATVVVRNEGVTPEGIEVTADLYYERVEATALVASATFQDSGLAAGTSTTFDVTFTASEIGRYLVRASVRLAAAADRDEIPSNDERVAHTLSNEFDFRDDVEAGVGGWTRDGLPNDAHRWEIVNDADENGSSHSPAQAWRFGYVPTLIPNPLPPQWHTLTSPMINVAPGPAFLIFYHRYDLWRRTDPPLPISVSDTDDAYVEVRTFAGAWSPWTPMAHYQERDLTWRGVSIDLTAAIIGATALQVRFNVSSDIMPDSGGWWVDDVMIAERGLGRAVVLLGPSGPIDAVPGIEFDVDLKAVNVGEFEDTFVLGASVPAGWSAVVRASGVDVPATGYEIHLAPDRDLAFRLRIRPAINAALGTAYTATITATSDADNTATDTLDIQVALALQDGNAPIPWPPELLVVLVAVLIPVILILLVLFARRRSARPPI